MSRRRTGRDGVSGDTVVVVDGIVGQGLAVGSLPSFGVSGEGVPAGKVVLEVVRLVVFLPSRETSEVSRRGLSGGPDCGSEIKNQYRVCYTVWLIE